MDRTKQSQNMKMAKERDGYLKPSPFSPAAGRTHVLQMFHETILPRIAMENPPLPKCLSSKIGEENVEIRDVPTEMYYVKII